MPNSDELTAYVSDILDITWSTRDGNVIPDTDDVALKDGAVKIDATFLYADLAGSSVLAQTCPWETTAKIIRAYLDTSIRIIKSYNGQIRSFDGDRVMGIFNDDSKNSNATKCAREIDWVVENIINPKATAKFTSISNNNIKIKHCIGIDTSEARAVRAGIRNSNDLIWIGRAPSFAAKLSDIRNYPYAVYISSDCYNALSDAAKYNADGTNMWTQDSVVYAGKTVTVYRTTTMLKP